MAAPKLTIEQRQQLLEWIAADYTWPLIRQWFADRKWPEITKQTVHVYRKRYEAQVAQIAAARRERALTSGLALREERVERLKAHADDLDAIKWQPDEKGRLWNEKAWRETLEQIGVEVGHRKQAVELSGPDGKPIILEVPANDRER